MFISDALYDFTFAVEGDQGNNDHSLDGSNYSLIWQLFFESTGELPSSEIHKIVSVLNPLVLRNGS